MEALLIVSMPPFTALRITALEKTIVLFSLETQIYLSSSRASRQKQVFQELQIR